MTILLAMVWGLANDAVAGEQPTAHVVVDGNRIVVNGQAEIPRGLFGVHASPHDPETAKRWGIDAYRGIFFSPGSGSRVLDRDGSIRDTYRNMPVVIDCQGDRYQVPLVLTNPNFKSFFDRIGREYAERTLAHPERTFYAEFWNEPYLNWASRSHGSPRNNYHPRFYDETKAVDGGPVTIKGWDKPLEHLRWRKLWAKGEDDRIYWGVKIPEGLKAGDTFRGASPAGWYFTNRREQTFTVVEQWGIEDPTQVGFWSGQQNYQFYMWMFKPWAKAIREVNPKVQIIAGWDFSYSEGDWAVWRELIRPMLDEAIEYIDGIAEHHYGISPRMVTVWYEMATAYTMSRHNRWVRSFNTECGPGQDPAVYGIQALENRDRDALRAAGGRAGYMLRDVLELIYHSPAKAGSRTAHHAREQGEGQAFMLLRPLRGPMVRTLSDDLDVWAVSSVNENRLVVVAINNAAEARQVRFAITAPDQATFLNGTAATVGVLEDEQGRRLAVVEQLQPVSGRSAELTYELSRYQAVRFELPFQSLEETGESAPSAKIDRRQFFAREGVLHDVGPDKAVDLTVAIPESHRVQADRAFIQMSLEKVREADVRLTLNGEPIVVPAGRNMTMRLPIDVDLLGAENRLRFEFAGDSNGDRPGGYRVVAASILVDAVKVEAQEP